jgi:predicted nucleic-acid-binding protein
VIAVDTNVLLRFSIADDPGQGKIAKELFGRLAADSEIAFVAAVTLAEFVWVLQRRYRVQQGELHGILETLLNVQNLKFEHEAAIRHAMAGRQGDFVDRFVHFIGDSSGCERTVTFDRRFARVEGVELLATAK